MNGNGNKNEKIKTSKIEYIKPQVYALSTNLTNGKSAWFREGTGTILGMAYMVRNGATQS